MKLHRDLGFTRKTAWFLAHRIRETWQDASAWFAWLPGFRPFDGPIEADEICVGGQRKNMSHEKRKQLRGGVGKGAVAGVKDRYVRDVAHTNGIESFWSMLKRGYVGVFHQLSAKYLDRYGAEFAGRHNIRLLDTLDMMLNIVVGIVGKRLPYKALVA